ncbi:GTA head formation protein, RCAP_rcc01685 family [Pontibaca methylaminivorans]|uniref:GTA head formation protein, RCAP_rcc01685 family n=1 Tax=Pontibaca methylaminivorans TaxID=515897 RepID=UPI002FD89238
MIDGRGDHEPFACAPGLRLAAHERVSQIHNDNLNRRLDRLEAGMERLEKRLWIAVYGVAAMILGQAIQSILTVAP